MGNLLRHYVIGQHEKVFQVFWYPKVESFGHLPQNQTCNHDECAKPHPPLLLSTRRGESGGKVGGRGKGGFIGVRRGLRRKSTVNA